MDFLSSKQHFVGCDVSKNTLDLAIHERFCDIRKFRHLKVSNDKEGFKKAIKWLKSNGIDCKLLAVAMEHTGVYSMAFTEFLSKKHIVFCMLHPATIRKACPQGRHKTDKDDAQFIADYVYTNREKLRPCSLENPQMKKLRQLEAERKLIIKNRTAIMNHIKTQSDRSCVCRLEETIRFLSNHIKKIERQMLRLIDETPEIKENYELLLTIPGVGMITAISTIIATGNFTRFQTARQYAKFCGVSPLAKDSGISVRGGDHVIKACHGELKAVISQGARSAIRNDQGMRQYYQRKISQGKAYGCVINAIKFKMICRMFAVVSRKKPYVNIDKYRT